MSDGVQAIGYIRCSTEEQEKSGLGLDAQQEAITREVDRRGWAVEILGDPGCSGKSVNPELRRALEMLARGQANVLIVSKMDRLARSVAHAVDIMDMARTQGWNLVVLDIGVDLATPYGRAMAQMLAVFAELEREMIGTRIREALAARRRRGQPVGRKVASSALIIHRIVTEREAGASFRKIAAGLTSDGVLSPTGRPVWQESTVRRTYASATRPVDIAS